jgi:hypothetical protein
VVREERRFQDNIRDDEWSGLPRCQQEDFAPIETRSAYTRTMSDILEVGRALDAWGRSHKMLDSAVDELVNLHVNDFKKDGDKIVHKTSGETLDKFCAEKLVLRPHWLSDAERDKAQEGEARIFDAKAACGKKRTLKGMGEFVKKYGEPAYKTECEKWGVRPGDLTTRGSNPYKVGKDGNAAETKTRNPFGAKYWNLTEQGRLYRLNPTPRFLFAIWQTENSNNRRMIEPDGQKHGKRR